MANGGEANVFSSGVESSREKPPNTNDYVALMTRRSQGSVVIRDSPKDPSRSNHAIEIPIASASPKPSPIKTSEEPRREGHRSLMSLEQSRPLM